MRLPRAVWVAAVLSCGVDQVEAQAASVHVVHAREQRTVEPGAASGPARQVTQGVAPHPRSSTPAPRPRLSIDPLAAAASRRRVPARGVIIGAVVGGVAVGAFGYHLREDTGVSPFRELAEPVLIGAMVGAVIGGVIQALLDR